MLVSYDRYMREFRAKQLVAKLERPVPQASEDYEVIHGVRVVQALRQAVKDSCRDMGGS